MFEQHDPLAEPRLFIVATVHLDTQWRWTVRDTIRDFLPRTLRENFSLFEVFPDYVLSFEGAFRYMLAEEYYPQDFERLRNWVEAGRWRIAGSMLDSPDVNLASAESLIRHILYAHHYFLDRFGTTSVDVFLPDCFGFPHSLPTLAAHCGLSGFSTSKMIKWVAPATRPFDFGLWEGPDGARLAAVLDPGGYGEPLAENLARSERWRRQLQKAADAGELPVAYRYFGTGDRGGSPDEASLYWLSRSLHSREGVHVLHSGSDELFRNLSESEIDLLPVHRGELLLPTHGTGCWTSQAAIKRLNRRNELLAESAEKAATMASWMAQFPYPSDQLRADWTRFLWHQMHDDVTGTSIPEAYDITVNDQVLCLNRFATLLTDAISAIARGLDTDTDGEPLVAFNPLSCSRCDAIEAMVEFPDEAPAAVAIVDPDGKAVPCQVVRRSGKTAEIVLVPELPPLSVSVLSVRAAAARAREEVLQVGEGFLDNSILRAELDESGDIASIVRRADGREALASPAGLELLPDRSGRWPAWEIHYRDICSPPTRIQGPAEVEVVERGPARVAVRVTRRTEGSIFRQTIRLAASQSRLEIANDIHWGTRSRLLKARFPLTAAHDEATYDLGCGVIRRGPNRPHKYEVPAHQWADVTDPDGLAGVSILSDSCYGWDKPEAGTLRLSLLRSPQTLRKFPHQATQDFGQHRFGYAIYPHAGSWAEAGTALEAARFNQPAHIFQATRHSGSAGRRLSFLESDQPSVLLRALKRSESGGEWILRLQETTGVRTHVALALGRGIGSGNEVNGCETPIGRAQVEAGRLHARLQPFQPKTFAVRLSPSERRIVPLPTVAVDLPADVDVASFHGDDRKTNFDNRGHSFPGELFPVEIMSGEILFRPAHSAENGPRAMFCHGQAIELPDQPFDSVFLLATTAADEGCQALFSVDDQTSRVFVDSWSGPIGTRWSRRTLFGRFFGRLVPPRTVRTPVAWLATHRHDERGRDEPYTFCYLFRYELELPDRGARLLQLPEEPRVALFAVTVADLKGRRLRAARAPYE